MNIRKLLRNLIHAPVRYKEQRPHTDLGMCILNGENVYISKLYNDRLLITKECATIGEDKSRSEYRYESENSQMTPEERARVEQFFNHYVWWN